MTPKPTKWAPVWRVAGVVGVFVLFAGMLFWTKLRLVSDIPRQAYAVPEEEAGDAPADRPLDAEIPGPAPRDESGG